MAFPRLFFVMTIGALLGNSAVAQTAPCSSALPDPPIFKLVLSSPVRLSFSHTVQAILSQPSVTIAGNEITVTQTQFLSVVAPPPTCNSQTVALGDLSTGSYRVTWKYQTLSNVPQETFLFPFTVPDAAPCVFDIGVQPRSPLAGQSLSIVYSAPYKGFLETPAVSVNGTQITIDQPAVAADPAYLGHVPCGRGVVQIGGLPPGFYTIGIRPTFGGPLSTSIEVRPGPRGRAVRGH